MLKAESACGGGATGTSGQRSIAWRASWVSHRRGVERAGAPQRGGRGVSLGSPTVSQDPVLLSRSFPFVLLLPIAERKDLFF